jgi:hypothetical protein
VSDGLKTFTRVGDRHVDDVVKQEMSFVKSAFRSRHVNRANEILAAKLRKFLGRWWHGDDRHRLFADWALVDRLGAHQNILQLRLALLFASNVSAQKTATVAVQAAT